MDYNNHKLRTLLIGLFILILLVNGAGAVTRVVPTNYASITAAYSAASADDTIQVNSGTYEERLVLSKKVTLQGVDTGSGGPIIDGSGGGNVITLNYNGCTVDGFVIRNAGTYRIGIQVSSNGNTISNNYISNNNVGINVMGHNNNHILNNVISSNTDGIQMHTGSSDNEISGNAVTHNNRNGIMLSYSAHNNTISDNDASYDGQTTLGDGISLYLCNGCTIYGNTASSNRQSGIYILQGNNNTITGNTANGNTRSGIDLSNTNDNIISGNTVTGNSYRGFEIYSASGNTFFTNILSNSVNAYSTSSDNDWNSTTSISWAYGSRTFTGLLGNVWSDYSGLDCNGDGLGDTPYNIAGGSEKDYHPIARVQSNPRLEVRKIANKTSADVGEWIKYTIWVNNTGNVSLTSVKAWDNLTSATWNVGTLTSGQNYSSTATYQVKASDMPGPLINKLFANGTNPCGGETNNSSIAVVSLIRTCSGIPKTITVCASGCDHTKIQYAINDACPGDTILVDSGTYNENVIVNKTLTLMGVDTGSGLPVVYGSGSGHVITISADGCTLQGFVMKNSGYHCSGIFVASNGNTISNNTVNSNSYGIGLDSSTNNIISGNIANSNSFIGINLDSSTNNTISGNTVNSNPLGIYLTFSNNNTISDNIAIGNYHGIYLYSASGNTISDNTFNSNHYGINLYSASGNTISDNTANSNHYGINLYSSAGNIISGNTATGSYYYGIHLDSSSSNAIYLNALSNTNNAWSNGNNHWNSTSALTSMYRGQSVTGLLGNIWSDYDGFDCDEDGIGDTPYKIAGGSDSDYHPIGGKVCNGEIQVKKLADRSGAQVGDWINYTIWINNTGNVNLTGVLAEDNLTSAFWNVGNLTPGQNFAATTRHRVNLSDLPGPLINGLSANGTDPCGLEVNNSSVESVDIVYSPQIIVSKTANLSEGAPSTIVSFKIEVKNTGNANFTSVDVKDILPLGLDYISDNSGLIASQDGRNYTWILGRLNSSQSFAFNLTACINGKKFGLLANAVNATGNPEYGSQVSSSATASILASQAGITVTKSADHSSGSGGALINFSMIVTNNGSALLQHVFVSDKLPAGLTYNSSSAGGICNGQYINWTDIGPLASGSARTLWVRGKIDGSVYGQLTNQVDVTGRPEHGDEVRSSAMSTVESSKASMMITKSVTPSSGSKGALINFTMIVTNNGSALLQHVFACAKLPSGQTYDSSSIVSGSVGPDGYCTDIGPLASGESAALWIKAEIDGSAYGTLSGQGTVTGQPQYGNNVTATVAADVLAVKANITVTKTVSPTFGSSGSLVTFSLVVRNTGDAPLPQIFVSDLLPEGMSYVSSDSGVNNGRYINWSNIGPLNPGEASYPYLIFANIDGTVSGTLTNHVDVEAQPEHGANVTANATASVQAEKTEITVTKIADHASGSPGTDVTFTLQIENSGDAALPQVFVSDLLPEGMSYISSSDSGVNNSRFINWSNVGLLAAGASKSLQIVASIDGPISGTKILTNRVDVVAQPEHGANAIANATAAVQAEEAGITISNIADPTQGPRGTLINFTLTVTNNGTASLPHVFVSDLLPAGLSYHSSSAGGVKSGQYINWTEIGPLASGASRILWIEAEIDGSVYDMLTNRVDVEVQPEHGEGVTASATADVQSRNICLSGHKFDQSSGAGLAGWTIDVRNGTSQWTSVTDESGDWQVCNLTAGHYTVCEEPRDGWYQVSPTGCYSVDLIGESNDSLDFYNTPSCNLTLTKTADKPTVHRGEDITYTIRVSNPCSWGTFTNVTVWDVLPQGVELVSASPTTASSNLSWFIGTLSPGQYSEVTIVVRIPIVDINYDMSQGVQGVGFVNVHNDYDTHQGPESVTNCAYAKADLVETLSSCASTKIIDPGTQLQSRESGSGAYESEELTRMRTENKSIRSISNLSAVHQPTSFSLPQNRSINYGTKWTDKSRGINTITGASMNEEYTFASKIDNDRSIELDRNGSTMKTEVEFLGSGHLGVLKKQSPDAHPKSKPIFESSEDYLGSFKVFEMVDEYGSSVKSNKSVTGYGYAVVDKRVRGSQRTYESGTGSYQSDEIIDTPSNYIAKDISLVRGPTSYNYTPRFNLSQNMLWSEGMWSRSGYLAGGDIFKDSSNCGLPVAKVDNNSPPASYISERYSSLAYLKKDSVALGLNEMKTNASFSGQADFEVKSIGENRTTKVDNEERYVGQYNIARKVLLTGVSKYDRPHITVKKEGKMTTSWFNKTNALVARYVITITNDGNVALAPINVRDIFPMGTEYIGSSIRPASLSRTDVNWTLVHLGIGNTIEIELELNLTMYAPGNIVNRVMVCGMNGDACVSGAAYAALKSAELPCCLPEVRLDKRAVLDATDPTLVHFTIEVGNNAESTVAATLTDMLPAGLTFLSASPEPSRQEGQFLEWIVPDLQPDGVVVIEYLARATMDGSYVNSVHLEATAVDGTGSDTADAAARVEVWSSGVAPKTTRYGGWQTPNWNMTSPDEGITIDLSPEEVLTE